MPRSSGRDLAVLAHIESSWQASDVHLARALRFGTWLVPTHLVKASPQVKIVAFASVFGAYWLAFPWMLTVWGIPSRVFALSYIVLAALLWGLKGGLLVTLVNIPVVISLLKVLGVDNVASVIAPSPR